MSVSAVSCKNSFCCCCHGCSATPQICTHLRCAPPCWCIFLVPGSQVKAGTATFDAWSTLRLHVTAAGGARKPQALKAFASWLRLKSGCLLEGAVLAQHHHNVGVHVRSLAGKCFCSCRPGNTAVSVAASPASQETQGWVLGRARLAAFVSIAWLGLQPTQVLRRGSSYVESH